MARKKTYIYEIYVCIYKYIDIYISFKSNDEDIFSIGSIFRYRVNVTSNFAYL